MYVAHVKELSCTDHLVSRTPHVTFLIRGHGPRGGKRERYLPQAGIAHADFRRRATPSSNTRNMWQGRPAGRRWILPHRSSQSFLRSVACKRARHRVHDGGPAFLSAPSLRVLVSVESWRRWRACEKRGRSRLHPGHDNSDQSMRLDGRHATA